MQECLSNCSGQGSGKTNELEVLHTLELQAYTDKSLSIYAVALFPEKFPQIANKHTMISHDMLWEVILKEYDLQQSPETQLIGVKVSCLEG